MTENKAPDIRKAEILEAALKHFNAGGYHNTSVEDIAAEVGITKAGVYYYFKSKKNLFLEIFRSRVAGYLEEITALTGGAAGAEEKLRVMTARSAELLPRHAEILKFCLEFFAQGMRDADIRKEVTLLCEKRIGAVRAIIKEGMRQGAFRRVDAESAARAVLFQSMGYFLVHFCSDIGLDAGARHKNIENLLDGLKK